MVTLFMPTEPTGTPVPGSDSMAGKPAHGLNYEMTLLDRQSAIEHWPVIGRLLLRAIQHGGQLSVRDYYEMVQSGDVEIMQCIDGDRLVAVMPLRVVEHIVDGAFHRVMEIMAIVGDDVKTAIGPMLEFIGKVARAEDCDGLVMTGRPGWLRWLQPHGFRPALHTQYRMF